MIDDKNNAMSAYMHSAGTHSKRYMLVLNGKVFPHRRRSFQETCIGTLQLSQLGHWILVQMVHAPHLNDLSTLHHKHFRRLQDRLHSVSDLEDGAF